MEYRIILEGDIDVARTYLYAKCAKKFVQKVISSTILMVLDEWQINDLYVIMLSDRKGMDDHSAPGFAAA